MPTLSSRRIDFWSDDSLQSRIIQAAVEVDEQNYGIYVNSDLKLMAMPLILDFICDNRGPSYGNVSKSQKVL